MHNVGKFKSLIKAWMWWLTSWKGQLHMASCNPISFGTWIICLMALCYMWIYMNVIWLATMSRSTFTNVKILLTGYCPFLIPLSFWRKSINKALLNNMYTWGLSEFSYVPNRLISYIEFVCRIKCCLTFKFSVFINLVCSVINCMYMS